MLENIRKYSAFMIIVVALLAFGLIVSNWDEGASASKGDLVVINGEGINQKELGMENPMPYAEVFNRARLTSQGAFALRSAQFDHFLIGYPEVDQALAPAVTLLLVQQEAKKLGIYVSQEDAVKFIREQLFVTAEGETDETRYSEFEKEGLKRLNMSLADFKQYIANFLTKQKIKEIKSAANIPFSIIRDEADLSNQTIDLSLVRFDIADFEEVAAPTEEEIEAFYEKHKNGSVYGQQYFRTNPKVKLTYVPVNLQAVDALLPDKSNQTVVESEKFLQEQTYDNYLKFLQDEELFGDQPDLEKLAKKYDLRAITTELVEAESLASYFDNFVLGGEFRNRMGPNGQSLKLHDYLVLSNIEKSRKLKLSIPGAYKDRGFVHYRIVEQVEPRLKTLEESKETVIDLIKKERQKEAMLSKAEEVKKLAEEAIKEGKDLAETLKESKVTILEAPTFAAGSIIPDSKFESNNLFAEAYKALPQSFTKVLSNSDSACFMFVKSRVIEKTQAEIDLEKLYSPILLNLENSQGRGFGSSNLGYYEWLEQTYKKAKQDGRVRFPGESK